MLVDDSARWASRKNPEIEVGRKFQRLTASLQLPSPIICDVGSYDATEGLYLLRYLAGAELHVFEPNPDSAKLCRQNVGNFLDQNSHYRGRIFLSNAAVTEKSGEATLNVVDPVESEVGDPGFSSLFRINPRYMKRRGRIVQYPVTVPTVTLDEYFAGRAPPDVLWVDVEGAELRVLLGAPRVLAHVVVLHLEMSFRAMQLSKPLFWTLDRHLRLTHQFELFGFEELGRVRGHLARMRLHPNPPWRVNGIYYRPDRAK